MNEFKESLKVEVNNKQEEKVDIQKENTNQTSNMSKIIEELIRNINEEVWYK